MADGDVAFDETLNARMGLNHLKEGGNGA